MKLKPYTNPCFVADEDLVGFFYAISNEEAPPFEERDILYSVEDCDEYSISSWDSPEDNVEYSNLQVGDRMYTFADVLRMYNQMVNEESFDKNQEKFYVYLSSTHVVEIESLLGND